MTRLGGLMGRPVHRGGGRAGEWLGGRDRDFCAGSAMRASRPATRRTWKRRFGRAALSRWSRVRTHHPSAVGSSLVRRRVGLRSSTACSTGLAGRFSAIDPGGGAHRRLSLGSTSSKPTGIRQRIDFRPQLAARSCELAYGAAAFGASWTDGALGSHPYGVTSQVPLSRMLSKNRQRKSLVLGVRVPDGGGPGPRDSWGAVWPLT